MRKWFNENADQLQHRAAEKSNGEKISIYFLAKKDIIVIIKIKHMESKEKQTKKTSNFATTKKILEQMEDHNHWNVQIQVSN